MPYNFKAIWMLLFFDYLERSWKKKQKWHFCHNGVRFLIKSLSRIQIFCPCSAFLRRHKNLRNCPHGFDILLSKFQNHNDDCSHFCGLLRKAELYLCTYVFKICTYWKDLDDKRLNPLKMYFYNLKNQIRLHIEFDHIVRPHSCPIADWLLLNESSERERKKSPERHWKMR